MDEKFPDGRKEPDWGCNNTTIRYLLREEKGQTVRAKYLFFKRIRRSLDMRRAFAIAMVDGL